MPIYTKEFIQKRLEMWLEAEAAVATGQSYKIGKRELTRAHISEIRKQLAYWNKELRKLNNGGSTRRVTRIVPRDL